MSLNRKKPAESEGKSGPPKYIVSYAAMMTILLAFFIMLNNLSTQREYGLKGSGLGVFRKSFNSLGLPGILPRSDKPVSLKKSGGKYIPADRGAVETGGKRYDGRLIKPEEYDLEETLMARLKTQEEVVLPLGMQPMEELSEASKERLASLARLIRRTDQTVVVRATMVGGDGAPHPWYDGSVWALRVAKYLCYEGGLAPERVTAVGCVAPPEEGATSAQKSEDATICLVLRPGGRRLHHSHSGADTRRDIHFRKEVTPEKVIRER